MRTNVALRTIVSAALLTWAASGGFVGDNAAAIAPGGDVGALVVLLGDAKVTLQQGLTASEQQGQPISAKFEVEDGKLQLSVYTMKDGKFFEAIVDHMTGKITKVEPIKEGEDLVHAKEQSAALTKAKIPLKEAVDKAVKGARAVSVTPDLKDGRPVASVTVLTGSQLGNTSEPLD